MDIEILREFVILSKGLNITKTSLELNIAQSTLSSHIIKLEKDLGAQLIERDPSPHLTLAGRNFLEIASDIVDQYDEFKKRNKKEQDQKEEVITIWAPQRREGFVMALLKMVIEFKKLHPYVTVDIKGDRSSSTLDDLKNGTLDCGYYCNAVNRPEVDEGYELVPLLDEEFIIWMDKDSPLHERKLLSPNDLRDHPLPVPVGTGTYNTYLPEMYKELFSLYDAKANIKPRYCRSTDDFFLSKIKKGDLIILNRGSQLVAAMNEANGKTICCFKPSIYSTGYLVFRSDEESTAVKSFKDYILDSYIDVKNTLKSE